MSENGSKVLIIGFVWPEPGSSAAGKRMVQLIDTFVYEGCDITFVSTARMNERSENLTEKGISCKSVKVNDESFDHFIRKLNPEIVLFDRFMTEEQFGWRVQTTCPDALRILDTEDLHFLRYARERAFKEGRDRIQDYLVSDIAKREIASIYRSDLSLIISESEMYLLKDYFRVNDEILFYLPFMIEEPDHSNTLELPSFSQRNGFMTIGNFRHKPNLDAVLFLKEEIWPGIRRNLPDAKMNVYGAYPTQQVSEWHNPDDGFLVHGRAESAYHVMQKHRICLAPIRFGAGLKGKLVEAMLNGTPSVTTTMGAEGICGSMKWPGFLADSTDKIISSAVRLYTDESLWEKSRDQGFTLLSERFSKEKNQRKFISVIRRLGNELQHHRRHNFTGAMLMHHTMASTRFMGRWIEEKNKKKDT